ncbi:unnamed protein product [Heterosigma akashiwo]|mmetsp:Transcript_40852/g.66884  ORF Transcript_40852/g.66884 Transcript_40852/m.66884 type:complete len:273 (+) Transcript_40852:63-881(+)
MMPKAPPQTILWWAYVLGGLFFSIAIRQRCCVAGFVHKNGGSQKCALYSISILPDNSPEEELRSGNPIKKQALDQSKKRAHTSASKPIQQGDGNPTWNPMFVSDEDVPNPSPVFPNDFNIPWSSAVGAGEPRPDLNVKEVPSLLMTALNLNDFPDIDSGLKSMWAFSSQTTKFVFSNNMTDFIESAHETAEGFPTSFYGVALNGRSWEMEGDIVRVGGDDGWIATQVMKTISSDGRMRRWQWELRMNRRPPLKGAWYVENIVYLTSSFCREF